jgi:hypothetical protein
MASGTHRDALRAPGATDGVALSTEFDTGVMFS